MISYWTDQHACSLSRHEMTGEGRGAKVIQASGPEREERDEIRQTKHHPESNLAILLSDENWTKNCDMSVVRAKRRGRSPLILDYVS